ncbi:MAG: L-serine ammonia-lyase [Deltaproteobacteria bacterium]|nr:MAG: L-serine ammonia-lyase [Deltaproteobacteria bacterium]
MFISILEIFKVGIGPSSSHTVGPIVAAADFLEKITAWLQSSPGSKVRVRCILKGSLSLTGRGHATDRAVALGLHGYTAIGLATEDVDAVVERLWKSTSFTVKGEQVEFVPQRDIIFDEGPALVEHPNGMIFELRDAGGELLVEETFFSVGGGFIATRETLAEVVAPIKPATAADYPYPFASAREMLSMAKKEDLSIAEMKWQNELRLSSEELLKKDIDLIWSSMRRCVERGLQAEGILPGGLLLARRAKTLYEQLLKAPETATINDWLCAYAMAVSEENAAGHMVVTAPTNGAAGVIPAVLYYLVYHEGGSEEQIYQFLLTAAAVGGLIKHLSSISGAEVGCQGEIGSASSMAAAGLCAAKGGSPERIEKAAEIALEHHLGVTCDPVNGLVQIPCIERNGFGAIKAWTACSLALRGSEHHFMPLDGCIAAMKQTGLEMSAKYKETSLGGLAVSYTEC